MALPSRFALIYVDLDTQDRFTLTRDHTGVLVRGPLEAPQAIEVLAGLAADLVADQSLAGAA